MNATVLDQIAAATVTAETGELDCLLRAPSSRKPPQPAAACLGRVVSLGTGGVVNVEFPGSGGTVAARMALPAEASQLLAAVKSNQPAVLVFENGDPALPIITGFIQPPPTADPAASGSRPEVRDAAIEPAALAAELNAPQVIEADVDGKRIRIVAQDEIVLECGNASITLRRNGRVVIRGTYVETYSEGTNRIKGGQVRIN
ncbi:MAG: hypothetical protein JWN85_307 [Gammaproteobacteria bacterium]|nr:hypothetical protein [Gammaproteobacteria bacterium]